MNLSKVALTGAISLLIVLFSSSTLAQVSGLIFSQSSGTYTPISGGTILGSTSSDDQYYVDPAVPLGGFATTGPGFPIGFNFTYNGHTFDRFGVQNNGWIALGNSSLTPSVDMNTTSSYTPLSSTAVNTPDYLRSRIAVLGRDLQAQTSPASDLEFAVTGSPGSQVLVVQWTSFRKYNNTGDNFSLQIRLYETTNKVEIVYGTMTSNTTSTTVQVGLGGTVSTDFNNRTTTTNWAATTAGTLNTDACTLVNTVVPPSGLTFTWTPFVAGANDFAAYSLDTPPNGGVVTAGTAFSPKATFKNVGTSPQPAGTVVRYQILNSVPAIVYNDPQTLGALAAGATEQKTFSSVAGGLAAGTYTIRAISYLAGDGNAANDTLSGTVISFAPISSFPYTEGFESTTFPPTGWNQFGTKNWLRYTGDFHGGTASAGIAYSPAGEGILQSPPINLPAGHRGNFWWKDADVFSPTIVGHDTTYFEITTNGGTSWTTLAFLSEPNSGTGWHQQIVDLSAYATTVFLRWRDVSDGTISAYGTWLDDVVIEAIPTGPPDSAHVVSPANLATNVLPIATLNWSAPTGGGSVTGYKLYFGTDNPPTNIVNGTNLGNVLTYDPSPNMTYSTPYYWKVVPTGPGGDAVSCPIWSFTVEADPTQPLPYSQDFNASTSLPAGWTADMFVGSTHGASGTNGLYRNLYASVTTCFATMPPVGPITSTSRLLFDYRIVKFSGYPATPDTLGAHDSLNVFVSTDGGTSFSRVHTIDTTNHAPSTSFAGKNIPLGSFAGMNVIIKFMGKWGIGDYYIDIDNVVVDNAVAKDIKVSSVSLSPASPSVGQAVTVSAVVQNLGTEPNPASVPLTYKIGTVPATSGDGTAQTFAPTWTGNLDTVTFTTTYTPGAIGSLTVGVRSFYAGDLNGSNDSAKVTTTVLPNKDIQVFAISVSPSSPVLGQAISISAEIRNLGTEANPVSVPLTYKIGSVPATSGDGVAQTFTPTWTGNADTVTFSTTYTTGSVGSLTIGVRSFYPADLVGANDSSRATITVYPAGTVLVEDFSGAAFPPAGWTNPHSCASSGWSRLAAVQPNGSSGYAARLNWWSVDSGCLDTLESPTIDLSALAALSVPKLLAFDHAYRVYPNAFDSLRVIISSDGGTTWGNMLFNDGAPNLETAPGSGEFTPSSASEWRNNVLIIPAPYLVATARIAFVGVSDFGNDLWLDNILVRALSDTDYAMISLTQENGIPNPFRPAIGVRAAKHQGGLAMPADAKRYPAMRNVNNSIIIPNTHETDAIEGLLPVTLKAVVQNIGQSSPAYQVAWTFDGVAQTPVSRGGIVTLATDTATLALTPPARGTFATSASVSLTGDKNPANNSRIYQHTLVYPDSSVRIKYDNGANTPEDYIGFTVITPVEAGVRFTATENMKLANIDAYYRHETSTDSIKVKVYAAGANDSTPGALLYSKKFGGANYFASGGDYFTLPLGTDAPTFSSGTNFWVSILYPPDIQYPGGVQTTGITLGHSFISADSGATWSSLVLPPEYAWLMRVVGLRAGSSTVTLGVSVTQNWNIVSLPVSAPTPNDSVRNLFVHSINPYAFAFSGGYVQRYTMTNGPGYWVKSSQTYTQNITGVPRDTLTISVPGTPPWNMIGSISTSIDTSSAHITLTPANLRTSNYFRYSGGYLIATTITPGLGYWVKASGPGTFFMHATGLAGKVSGGEVATSTQRSIEDLNTLTIQDANGGSQTLYFGADAKGEIPVAMFAMPPAPPAGSFDARFESSEGGLMVQTHAERIENVIDLPIAIQSNAYPLTVTWKVADGSYELSDGVASRPMRGEGTLKVMNSEVRRLVLKVTGSSNLPKEFSLSQNYPNPFNPTTNIKYALPVDSKLTMELYNVLGQRVRTLVNDNVAAGYHVAEWDGTGNAGQQLASGMYFLRMSAKGTNGKSFNEVRKLMMLK